MSDAIVVALITGVCAIIGSIITGQITSSRSIQKMDVSQAVIDTKIEELTREVRAHNNFAQRMPVVETQIEVLSNEISELKAFHKPTC